MRKIFLTSLLIVAVLGANAQTISLTTATPQSSNTIGGANSVRIGTGAGNVLSTGNGNTFVGKSAGANLTTGNSNTFVGINSGSNINCVSLPAGCVTTGDGNAFFGASSGIANNGGNNNVFFGAYSGSKNLTGSNNTYIGYLSGSNNAGSGNIFIGANSSFPANQVGTALNNTLCIDNSRISNPLIWGDFAADQLKLNGKVGIGDVAAFPTLIGTENVSNYKLFVTGGILADEVRVKLSASGTWADYVFANDYDLKPLSEVEKFIDENGHLPNVPSAAQVKEEGINVADMARIQQEKIEELMLYIIQQNKRIEALEAKLNK